jgi:ABC-2 type transport system ATP-binding protein
MSTSHRHDRSAGADEPAIRVRGLRRAFGDVVALDGLDLDVRAGTVLGLLGPNGAGKTTLVRTLATLVRPDAGSARVLGHDVVDEPLAVRRRIGLAGQFAAVDGELTGRENVEMIGRLYRLPATTARRRAAEVLERFGLADAADRAVSTYSGGMRRRLDLAASLTGRPPVILLDEPTTGLDPATRQELWSAVDELRRAGTTVLLTTQYLEEADRLAQRIAVVDHGRIAAQGTAAELKATIGSDVLAIRLADAARAPGVVAVLGDLDTTGVPFADGATGELRLTVASPDAAAEAVRRLDAHGVRIAAIATEQPSLDDVFLTLTGRRSDDRPARTTDPQEQAA